MSLQYKDVLGEPLNVGDYVIVSEGNKKLRVARFHKVTSSWLRFKYIYHHEIGTYGIKPDGRHGWMGTGKYQEATDFINVVKPYDYEKQVHTETVVSVVKTTKEYYDQYNSRGYGRH